ncbi:2-oxo acid dehydrogenase subunit E2 [Kroppenstedtia pulmonis]|uniref:Dihydrolipoamide acetyltransferase component of pyruvate dehydrogenase complex n=1 Tax=Kroppenstedtia pulmonis TaxID=1380685 RepID=A0A7D3Y8G6_9BACL|nr:dihydrolipoamide acetyltransferase family protein [Kroppenstedtia pulmonis]QKG83581.1 2-oxo acid dehydrogenase subunit E2 [Kroppenstedtia pulmonis]
MSVHFKLPDVGEGVAEAEVIRWLVRPGEQVEQDQGVVEVQTDKAVVELPSPAEGLVEKVHWQEGETVPVGEVLLVIQPQAPQQSGPSPSPPPLLPSDSEEQEGPISQGLKRSKEPQPERIRTAGKRRVMAAPSTRRLARELGIDLSQVHGTGPQGRVTPEDVRKFAKSDTASSGLSSIDAGSRINGSGDPLVEKLCKTREVIAKRLHFSVTQKPHVTHFDELNAEGLVSWRRRLKEESGIQMSYFPVLLKALAVTIRHHPQFNAHFDEEQKQIHRFTSVHLGIAVDTPRGLLVPVIRDVDRKNIVEIAKEVRHLTQAAQNGSLSPDQLRGSTLTVSNVGPLGGRWATPIINPPEVAILAIHPIEQRPVVIDGKLTSGWRMNVSLSFDHRILDGADAIRFTQTLEGYLRDMGKLVLELS